MINNLINLVTENDPKEDLLRVSLTQDPKTTKLKIFTLLAKRWPRELRQLINLSNTNTDNLMETYKLVKTLFDFTREDVDKYVIYDSPEQAAEIMLDSLDKEVWSNPSLKWLDPCSGFGLIAVKVVERLMKGLEEWQPNKELRYKHIVEEMIYCFDIVELNCFFLGLVLDPKNQYKLNITNSNYLVSSNDLRFDISLLTAPFKSLSTNGRASTPIYSKFILKALKQSNLVLSINPSVWTIGGKGLGSLRKAVLSKGILKELKDLGQYYKNTTSSVHLVYLDNNNKGLTKIDGVEVSLKGFKSIPTNPKAFSILDKLKGKKSIQSITKFGTFFGVDYRNGRGDNLKTEKQENSLLCHVSSTRGTINYIDKSNLSKNVEFITKYKVLLEAIVIDKLIGKVLVATPNQVYSDAFISILADTEEEANNILKFINTKFFRFLLGLRKISWHTKPSTLKYIPLLDFSREWVDQDLYKEFNLSSEEIDLIEKYENS